MRSSESPCKTNAGFTLIDLMIALVVAGVLLTVAVPSMRNFVQDARITTDTNELVLSLGLARSEAIKRYTTVSLCAGDDGIDCTDTDMLVAACENCTDDDYFSRGSGSTTARSNLGDIAGRMLLAILGINDAMAVPGDSSDTGGTSNAETAEGSGGYTGGFESGCSDQTASNSAASETCSDNPGGGGPGGGGGAPLFLFTVCDNRTGETGRGVDVVLTGRVSTGKLACE